MNLERVKLSRPFIPFARLLDTYRPFISKVLIFDTMRAGAVLGIKSAATNDEQEAEMDRSSPGTGPGDHVTETVTDPPLDCGALEVDCATAIRSRWGTLNRNPETGHALGWIGYLECARDEMEKRGHGGGWECYLD